MNEDKLDIEIIPAGQGAMQQHEAAAMDIQVATAQKLGRNLAAFQADLESWSTASQEIAEECTYVLKKGGNKIVGPSIRFAELLQQAYRHIVVDVFIEEEAHGYVVCGAMARDLYRNTAVRGRVRRSLLRKDGTRVGADQVQTTVQAAQSLALRNAIIRLIPKALWLPIWLKSREVATGGSMPFQDRLQAAFATLATYGVTQDQVLAHLGRESRQNMDADDLILLRNKVRAMRAGELDPDYAFPPANEPDEGSGLAKAQETEHRIQEAVKAAGRAQEEPAARPKAKAKAKPRPQQAPEQAQEDPSEPEDGVEVQL